MTVVWLPIVQPHVPAIALGPITWNTFGNPGCRASPLGQRASSGEGQRSSQRALTTASPRKLWGPPISSQ